MQNCSTARGKAVDREQLTVISLEETEDSVTRTMSQFPDMMTLDVIFTLLIMIIVYFIFNLFFPPFPISIAMTMTQTASVSLSMESISRGRTWKCSQLVLLPVANGS